MKRSTISTVSACSRRSRAYSFGWLKMAGSDSARAISLDRSSIWRSLSNSIAAQRARWRTPFDGRGSARCRPSRSWGPAGRGAPMDKEKAGRSSIPPASERVLRRRQRLALVLLLESLDPTGRVHELVLTGIERMALGAHFHADVGLGGTGVNHLAARARDGRVHIIRMNTHLHCRHPLRATKNTSPGRNTQNRGIQPRLPHRVHRGQELLVGLGELELVQQELHALDGVELRECLAKEPDFLKLVLLEEQLFFPGPRLLDVDSRKDALVHQPAVEVNLHVAGSLELLEDDVVHPAAGIDDGGGHDRQRAALFDVPCRREA